MKVLGQDILDCSRRRHADCDQPLRAWLSEVQHANWKTPTDVKARYPHCSVISGARIVFNIRGGNYRLDVKVNFTTQTVLIKRFGTHAEYSKWTF